MFGMPIFELIELAAAVIAAGIITGLLAGLFGIGGGAVIVPVLYEAFRLAGVPEEVRMQLCIGTSLAIIVPTAVRSYVAHRARGLVIPEVMRLWAVPAVIGVAIGSAAAVVAPPELFKAAFVHPRLRACRAAAPEPAAAFVDRLRLGDRAGDDRADLQLCRAIGRAARACRLEAHPRNRLRRVSGARRRAFPVEPDRAAINSAL